MLVEVYQGTHGKVSDSTIQFNFQSLFPVEKTHFNLCLSINLFLSINLLLVFFLTVD